MPRGPKGAKRPGDVIGAAVMIGQIATGEIDDLTTDDGKNAAAVALGRMGGKARAESMSARRRKEIATKAAKSSVGQVTRTDNDPNEGTDMAAIQHEFYRSFRGPAPADEDSWSLVFDPETRSLLVRHEWQARGHSGVDDVDITEFLQQTGGAQTALIDSLFRMPTEA